MTRLIRCAAVALILSAARGAQAQEPAPCAAMNPNMLKPCAATSELESETAPPLATIDGTPVTVNDLDEATRKKVEALPAAQVEAREKALRAEIDDMLLQLEAARRGTTVGTLLQTEVNAHLVWPADADVAAEIAASPDKYKRGKEDSTRAAAVLFDRNQKAREAAFVATLEKRWPVKVLDGRTVLASVGDEKLTAARASLRMETAEADVRIKTLEAEKGAVERVIHDRLLAAEAKRQGISTDELVQREVTSKLAPASDAELKAEWEKFRKFYGDDFEQARDRVKKSVESDRKAAADKAFDARLREGHAVRVLIDVPARPVQTNLEGTNTPSSGPRDAKVTLVEFGDFQCPPCGFMSGIVEEALRPYQGRVRYVFRQYPLTMHRFAAKAAEAGLAAHAQGKFFPYAHALFANQDALDVASLKKYASDAGLDRKRFDDDLDSGRFAPAVIEDLRAGERAGVIGTPAFFLNGVRLGYEAYSVEGMRAAIDRALALKP